VCNAWDIHFDDIIFTVPYFGNLFRNKGHIPVNTKNATYNGQREKDKTTNNGQQNSIQKTK
jgi:1-acyl-sn-glycerol-3-phosphate acyltransferase